MTEFYIPTGYAQAEFVEKRSRFIGQIWRVESEQQARDLVAQTKSKYYDARHSCWCCIIREGGVMRYSDDGEPQGTAGQPMLEVFKRNNIENVCCIVTRYFGGILLGAGGLVRAYSHTAKLALDASGISVVRMWNRLLVDCSYAMFERVKVELAAFDGVIENVEYDASILLTVLLPEGREDAFQVRMADISSGAICVLPDGSVLKDVPIEKPHES